MDSFKRLSSIAFALLAGCASAAPLPTRSTISNSNSFAARIVAAHYRERAAVGVVPLTWDPMLEAGAASYARGLALTARFAPFGSRQPRRNRREFVDGHARRLHA